MELKNILKDSDALREVSEKLPHKSVILFCHLVDIIYRNRKFEIFNSTVANLFLRIFSNIFNTT